MYVAYHKEHNVWYNVKEQRGRMADVLKERILDVNLKYVDYLYHTCAKQNTVSPTKFIYLLFVLKRTLCHKEFLLNLHFLVFWTFRNWILIKAMDFNISLTFFRILINKSCKFQNIISTYLEILQSVMQHMGGKFVVWEQTCPCLELLRERMMLTRYYCLILFCILSELKPVFLPISVSVCHLPTTVWFLW